MLLPAAHYSTKYSPGEKDMALLIGCGSIPRKARKEVKRRDAWACIVCKSVKWKKHVHSNPHLFRQTKKVKIESKPRMAFLILITTNRRYVCAIRFSTTTLKWSAVSVFIPTLLSLCFPWFLRIWEEATWSNYKQKKIHVDDLTKTFSYYSRRQTS